MSITFYKLHGFYLINDRKNIRYSMRFPTKWAQYDRESRDTCDKTHGYGPIHCHGCRTRGTYKGVFIQYCDNCVKSGNRPGCACVLQDVMPEVDRGKIYGYACKSPLCIFNTYLKDVNLCSVGKKNHIKLRKF